MQGMENEAKRTETSFLRYPVSTGENPVNL